MNDGYAELHLDESSLRLLSQTVGQRWRRISTMPTDHGPSEFHAYEATEFAAGNLNLTIRSTLVTRDLDAPPDNEYAILSVRRSARKTAVTNDPWSIPCHRRAGERILEVSIIRDAVTETTAGSQPWRLSVDSAIVFRFASSVAIVARSAEVWDDSMVIVFADSVKTANLPSLHSFRGAEFDEPDDPHLTYSVERAVIPIAELIDLSTNTTTESPNVKDQEHVGMTPRYDDRTLDSKSLKALERTIGDRLKYVTGYYRSMHEQRTVLNDWGRTVLGFEGRTMAVQSTLVSRDFEGFTEDYPLLAVRSARVNVREMDERGQVFHPYLTEPIRGIRVVRDSLAQFMNGNLTWEFVTDVAIIFEMRSGVLCVHKSGHHDEAMSAQFGRWFEDLVIPDRSCEWDDQGKRPGEAYRRSRTYFQLSELLNH